MFDPITLGIFYGAAKLGAAAIERYERSKTDKRRAERRRIEAANPITAPAVEDNREQEEQRIPLIKEEDERVRREQDDREKDAYFRKYRERVEQCERKERERYEQHTRENLEKDEQIARMQREDRERAEQHAREDRERYEQDERELNSMRDTYIREFRERHEQIQVQALSDEAARVLAEKWA